MKYTALLAATLIAAPAFAEQHMSSEDLIRSRDITGGNIYTMATAMDDSEWDGADTMEMGDDWNNIGEIEDLVLDSNGQVVGIVAEIGGFLDIADKHVMIETSDLKLVPVDDRTYAYVTRRTEEQLEEQEGIDEAFWN